MTDDELERWRDFILEQQAQFATDIQQLRQSVQQLGEAQARTDQVVNRLAAVTLEGFKDVNAKIDALVDSHLRLTEAQARTDENLRNLIAIVGRYFSQDRNGRSEA
jgi:ABC-type transporter Mla subunit MlaD